MAPVRRFGLLDLLMFLLVLVVAGGARAGYLLVHADGGKSSGPLAVQDDRKGELSELMENVQEGPWFGSHVPFGSGPEVTAHVSPGYPYLVGLLGRYVGDQRDYIVRWTQLGLGTLTAGFYFLFARRAFRSLLVGCIAGLAAALHPFWILNITELDDGTLATFALSGCLLLAGRTGEKGGALASLLLGGSLAGLALVRAAMLPFSFVTLVWFLLRSGSLPRGWLCALCAFLGFASGLAAWSVRNYQEFNEPVPVTSTAYLHLWIGNNANADGGTLTPDMIASVPVQELQGLKQTDRYARLGKEVHQEITERPVKTMRRRLNSALGFVFGTAGINDGLFARATSPMDEEPEPDSALIAAVPMLLLSTLLALLLLSWLGWRWSYGWRWESIPAMLAGFWIPLPYVLSHAETLSGPRLPFDGVLICFASFALCCLIPGFNSHLLDAPESGPGQPTA